MDSIRTSFSVHARSTSLLTTRKASVDVGHVALITDVAFCRMDFDLCKSVVDLSGGRRHCCVVGDLISWS